ncbi:hypothetical protein [Vibrio ishigakensis]|uniref:hypothetical protein n=1 Tax=Vibrio ishigakensis TaxID=1481914 RepID=UPI0021C45049|nr:hypothetical protein [Vibrio ishigakensis]
MMEDLRSLHEQGVIEIDQEMSISSSIRYKNTIEVDVWYHQDVTPTFRPGSYQYTFLTLFKDSSKQLTISQLDICSGNACHGPRSYHHSLQGLDGSFSLKVSFMAGKWAALGTSWNMFPRVRIIADGQTVVDDKFETHVDPTKRTLAPGHSNWKIVKEP